MARLLIVDGDRSRLKELEEAMALGGHEIRLSSDGIAARGLLNRERIDITLLGPGLAPPSALELLGWIKEEQPEIEVIVLSAGGEVDTAVEAMRLGAFHYMQMPSGRLQALQGQVSRAADRRARHDERAPTGDAGAFRLTWGAPSMGPVEEAIRRVAPTQATVLLTGESGVGKEVAARVIHQRSPRAAGPFVVVNCASFSDTLLESELFGHERGAFTGALQRRRGRLELASGGTFFLDEVGELKPDLQARLLRVIQTKSFERVGGSQTIHTDVRWVAATNRDLHQMMSEGTFREDLYHRLAVFPVHLPPLRRRRRDIGPLMDYLLLELGRSMGRGPLTLEASFREELMAYPWPGNVRELMNVLERAAILSDGPILHSHPMILGPMGGGIESQRDGQGDALPLGTLEEIEREAIRLTLGEVEGNRRRAAEELGIGVRTLYTKLKLYGLS